MLKNGDKFFSPGCSFEYLVIGAVCVLYDRENLPYPCCNLSWRGKQPSWRRVGKRFVPDKAVSDCESYNVRLVDGKQEFIFSFSYKKLPKDNEWFLKAKK